MYKKCSGCKQIKLRTEFHVNNLRKDGRQNFCIECKDKHAQARRAKKKALLNRQTREWKKRNKDKVEANYKKREEALKRATPPWLSQEERKQIALFYSNCPRGHVVDHFLPLAGKYISGLNVLANLQYLPIEENLKKKNKFEPYIEIFKNKIKSKKD